MTSPKNTALGTWHLDRFRFRLANIGCGKHPTDFIHLDPSGIIIKVRKHKNHQTSTQPTIINQSKWRHPFYNVPFFLTSSHLITIPSRQDPRPAVARRVEVDPGNLATGWSLEVPISSKRRVHLPPLGSSEPSFQLKRCR